MIQINRCRFKIIQLRLQLLLILLPVPSLSSLQVAKISLRKIKDLVGHKNSQPHIILLPVPQFHSSNKNDDDEVKKESNLK